MVHKRINGVKEIILLLMFFVFGFLCVRGTSLYEISGNLKPYQYSEQDISVVNYEVRNGIFYVVDTDPQMYLHIKEPVYGFKIHFKEEMNLGYVQIFYCKEGEEFSEANSLKFSGTNGKAAYIALEDTYDKWRIDIDCDFSIDSIEIVGSVSFERTDKLWKYIVIEILMMCIALVLIKKGIIQKFDNLFCSLRNSILLGIKNRKTKQGKQILLGLGILVILCLVFNTFPSIDIYRRICCIILAIVAMILIYAYKYLDYSKIHRIFLVIIILIGGVHALFAPPTLGLNWDDETHYVRTQYMSYGLTGSINKADKVILSEFQNAIFYKANYGKEERTEFVNRVNNIAENKLSYMTDEEVLVSNIAYIPAAIVASFLRGIGMEYMHIFRLSRLVNLIVYALIFALAIKCLKKGKLLLVAIACIPTSLFMASSYSYDGFLISMIALSYSMIIGELQEKGYISSKNYRNSVIIATLGIMVKAVYFPLLVPLLLFKKEKYESYKKNIIYTLIAIGILCFSFVIPTILQVGEGSYVGDQRGGTDVNGTEQIHFVLSHMGTYIGIFFNFLKEYISLDNSRNYLTYMAYYGVGRYATLFTIILVLSASMDSALHIKVTKRIRIINLVACFCSVGLVATSMYIAFTPVGSDVILGCQYRYLLPVLYPFLALVCSVNIDIDDNKKMKLLCASLFILSLIFLVNIYEMCFTLCIS